MSSIAQQPRTGHRSFTLRAYLAGTAATAALLGAVVLAFASLGAYVAFNGLPIGGDSTGANATSVEVGNAAAAPAAKAARHLQVTHAVGHAQSNGAGAATGSHATSTASHGGSGGSVVQTTAQPASPVTQTGTSTATVSTGGSGSSATATPTSDSPSTDSSPVLPTPHVTAPSSVSSTVGNVEQTLHDAGIDIPLAGQGSTVDHVADGLLGGN